MSLKWPSEGTVSSQEPYPVNVVSGGMHPTRVVLTSSEDVNSSILVRPHPDYLSSFDRLRVANPFSLADLINIYEIDYENYITSSVGSGYLQHLPNQSSILISVSGGLSGASAVLQTKDYYRYQAGKGLFWYLTLFHNDLGYDGQKRDWGFFDSEDGIFFRLSGTYNTSSLQIVRRTSTSGVPVEPEIIPQMSWSIDPMDGTGPSGKTLDIRNGNIYEVRRLQWLGVGDVALYINEFPVHIMEHKGLLDVPYMKSAQLPLTWRIDNVSSSVSGSMRFECAHVGVDGGEEPSFHAHSWTMTGSISVPAAEKYLFSVRLKQFYPTGSTIKNRMMLMPLMLNVSSETKPSSIRLVWNASNITGATFSVDPDMYSGAEIDIAGTSLTGGSTISEVFISVNTGVNLDISDLFSRFSRRMRRYNGQNDVLSILATGNAGSADIKSGLFWKEIR